MKSSDCKVLGLGVSVKLEEGQPYAILLTFNPKALKMIGVLEKVTETISRHKFPIVNVLFSMAKRNEPIYGIFIIDVTGGEERVPLLIEELKSINTVENVIILKPLASNIIVIDFFDRIEVLNNRAIIMRKDFYEGFIKEVWKMFGTGGGAMLYHIGVAVGKRIYESHESLVAERGVEKLLRFSESIFKAMGFGRMEIRQVDKNLRRAKIIVEDSFECELFKGKNKPASHFLRGILKGWFSGFFGMSSIEITEVKCIAAGDPYCEFIIMPGR